MSNRQPEARSQGLWSDLVPVAAAPEEFVASRGSVLGRIRFTDAPADAVLDDATPLLTTHMTNEHVRPVEEIWRTALPVRTGSTDDAVFAEDGEHLFYAVRLGPRPVYRRQVRELYENALGFTWERGYTDLVRMWNLIGGITSPNADGLEIYRDFCTGRAEAFAAFADRFPRLPAATGIGTLSPGVDVCFIAAKPGRAAHLENPRQTPAYKYPSQYGPKSPSFARATFLKDAGAPGSVTGSLFVSGTASILGDDTVHADNVALQTEETLRNIEALVGGDNLRAHGLDGAGYDVKDLDQVKVYVRDAEHLPVVRNICESTLPADTDISYFNVAVCRPDLLVEIEGVCR
ncbi:FkbO/Hyg5 family chorismatase [Streptomyces sp. NPDC101776]|uniref:FkbO/Hyg5 family chorismatase n=1 Tax=Streptomyces sp. NPDC101776 TaxID=3366146 RepID=UPI00380F6F20